MLGLVDQLIRKTFKADGYNLGLNDGSLPAKRFRICIFISCRARSALYLTTEGAYEIFYPILLLSIRLDNKKTFNGVEAKKSTGKY